MYQVEGTRVRGKSLKGIASMLNGIGLLVMSSVWPIAAVPPPDISGLADTPFVQEYHEAYPLGDAGPVNDVRTIAVDRDGRVWAGTQQGVFRLDNGASTWTRVSSEAEAGPVFDLCVDHAGAVWVGAWNGLCRAEASGLVKVQDISDPIAAVCETNDGIVAVGPDGIWRGQNNAFTRAPLLCAQGVRGVLPASSGGLWIATENGLFFQGKQTRLYQSEEDILSADVRGIATSADGTLWAAGLCGITLYTDGRRIGQFTTRDGLPAVFVQCISCAPDGVMWVGTTQGVARYRGADLSLPGKGWSLRHDRRWLLDDDVRDVAFAPDGTAWVATAKGVSAIKRKQMTLAEKAGYFERVSLERHTRTPWLVELCRLRTPGDVTTWEPVDDDNDGQYTAMYLAMESSRYAATQDPAARENAKKAFEALRFLQTVTETPGFFARTVIPSAWTSMKDPGDKLTPQEWAQRRVEAPRYKKVEVRWHPSKDGQWLWKGDTSSDEVTGHFFGYTYYYDVAADDEQKQVVREHVRKVMDYIIDGGYVFKDVDGTHTRWAVWAPERLNRDPNWAAERGVNSAEILSFLKVTHHITGDEKYQKEYLRLLRDEGYAENLRRAKTFALSWRTHIDDELLALAYPGLLRYEEDPALRALYRDSLDHWYTGVKADCSPFFEMIYASLTAQPSASLDCMAYLRDVPLDLINWTMDNSKREDLQLVRAPEIEPLQTSRLLPPSERGVIRWDKNPWEAVQGDGGHSEWAPTFWLLPYWMGRYCGYIKAPT